MDWLYLVIAAIVIWGLCGAVMGLGRRFLGLEPTLRVHLAMAPIFSFGVSLIHARLAPAFNPLIRALFIAGTVVLLDATVVAPLFEKSYSMFRSLIGTWIPFALIFLASWAAGLV